MVECNCIVGFNRERVDKSSLVNIVYKSDGDKPDKAFSYCPLCGSTLFNINMSELGKTIDSIFKSREDKEKGDTIEE